MNLVIGATGQLGCRIVRKLVSLHQPVRALVRSGSSRSSAERTEGVQRVHGDLRDEESLRVACSGVKAIFATANAVAPRAGDDMGAIEDEGYRLLIRAAEVAGVEQFIMISVPAMGEADVLVPTFRYKRLNERRLEASPMPHTVVRASMFMSSWLALLGSSIPLRGIENASLERPWRFLRRFRAITGRSIEERGKAMVPGPGHHRNAFVDDGDVAEVMVRALGRTAALNATWEIGGPEALSWDEVVGIYARLLGRDIRASYTPGWVFRAAALALRPISPGAANIMGLNWWAATHENAWNTDALADSLGIRRTRVEEYLAARIPAARPSVPA